MGRTCVFRQSCVELRRQTRMARIAFLTNIVSPHRIPLATELVAAVGRDNYRYYYTEPFHSEREEMGWGRGESPDWCVQFSGDDDFIASADLFISGLRRWDLISARSEKGLPSIYTSERWFKPGFGFLRIFVPSYFRMAKRFVKMLSSDKPIYYFPQGIYAARDMARLCGLFHGDLRCLFRAPKLDFERRPGGWVWEGRRKKEEVWGKEGVLAF